MDKGMFDDNKGQSFNPFQMSCATSDIIVNLFKAVSIWQTLVEENFGDTKGTFRRYKAEEGQTIQWRKKSLKISKGKQKL